MRLACRKSIGRVFVKLRDAGCELVSESECLSVSTYLRRKPRVSRSTLEHIPSPLYEPQTRTPQSPLKHPDLDPKLSPMKPRSKSAWKRQLWMVTWPGGRVESHLKPTGGRVSGSASA